MSLTLPSAYSSASKLGNIQENWIVQLGFYNGDAQGSGEGGWDAVLRTGGSPNLINKLGSDLIQDGTNPDPSGSNWTRRDADGNADGWTEANPPAYEDDETASLINTLSSDIEAGKNYSLTFTVGVETLSLLIGGGDLSGNSSDETLITATTYALGAHTVSIQPSSDRTHLWFTAYVLSGGNGTLDNIILKNSGYGSAETSIVIDDGSVFSSGDFIKIEDEILKITNISSNTLTVERGAMGTTAASHFNNTALYWNNFAPISTADTVVGNVFYHGVITNTPSIRTSINLANSTAQTGNISLNVINFQYKADDFSAELFLGTRKYINREVRIYSQLNTGGDGGEEGVYDTAVGVLSNCLQIYSGRLINMAHDDSKITLQLTEQRPWDFITVPQDKTTAKKQFIPIVYGDFSDNTNSHGSQGYCTSQDLWEMPNISDTGDNVMGLSFQALDGTAGTQEARIHIYERGADIFTAISTADGGTSYNDSTKSHDGQNVSYVANNLYRGFTTKPLRQRTDDAGDNDDAFDSPTADDTSTESSITHTLTITGSAGNDTEYYRWECPQINGKVTVFTMVVNYAVTTTGTGQYSAGGGNIGFSYSLSNNTTIGGSTDTTTLVSHSNRTVTAQGNSGTITMTSEVASNGYKLPDYIEIRSYINEPASGNNGTITAAVKMYDCRLKIKTEEVFDDGKLKEKSQEVRLFCGANGYTESWSGSNAAIQYGHEALRDLLIRFAGYTTTAPENWTALNTDRAIAAWKIQWWALKPVELKKVLEQIMYEFGFIFKFRADGTGSVIHILQTSELSATVTLNQHDTTNLKINNSPFSELLTKMEINYEKHPAESRYISNVTSSNTTARKNWNIQTEENIKEVNFGMNVGTPNTSGQTDGNEDFYSYYDNIFGDIKKIINCDIVNPAKGYNLETGDIIQFSNTAGEMIVEPFGDDWADYYMITDLQRSPGKITIQCREVG